MIDRQTNEPTSNVYAMRRANGDWFALDDQGAFRVPLFRSNGDAMQARAFNGAMLLFRPVVIDEIALESLGHTNGTDAYFWLVDQAAVNLKRGHRLAYEQLSVLVRKGGSDG